MARDSGEAAGRRQGSQLERQLRASPNLVVAEEYVRVEPVGEERLEAVEPGAQLIGRVILAPQAEVQERAGPPDGRQLRVVGKVGRDEGGTGAPQSREGLVDVPRRVLEIGRASCRERG